LPHHVKRRSPTILIKYWAGGVGSGYLADTLRLYVSTLPDEAASPCGLRGVAVDGVCRM
jgi:hypothetical protein